MKKLQANNKVKKVYAKPGIKIKKLKVFANRSYEEISLLLVMNNE